MKLLAKLEIPDITAMYKEVVLEITKVEAMINAEMKKLVDLGDEVLNGKFKY